MADTKDMSSKMKVRDAKAVFDQWAGSLSETFDMLIESFKAENPEEGMPNDNYFHALFYTDYMFRSTKHHLRMLSGANGDGFLGILKKSFEAALQTITKNKGFVRIILIDGGITPFLKSMMEKYPIFKITLASLVSDEDVPHTIVCDDYMVREENLHEKVKDDSDIRKISATVYFDNADRAHVAAKNFDATWSYLNGEIDD